MPLSRSPHTAPIPPHRRRNAIVAAILTTPHATLTQLHAALALLHAALTLPSRRHSRYLSLTHRCNAAPMPPSRSCMQPSRRPHAATRCPRASPTPHISRPVLQHCSCQRFLGGGAGWHGPGLGRSGWPGGAVGVGLLAWCWAGVGGVWPARAWGGGGMRWPDG